MQWPTHPSATIRDNASSPLLDFLTKNVPSRRPEIKRNIFLVRSSQLIMYFIFYFFEKILPLRRNEASWRVASALYLKNPKKIKSSSRVVGVYVLRVS